MFRDMGAGFFNDRIRHYTDALYCSKSATLLSRYVEGVIEEITHEAEAALARDNAVLRAAGKLTYRTLTKEHVAQAIAKHRARAPEDDPSDYDRWDAIP